jgi:hypothetical protein
MVEFMQRDHSKVGSYREVLKNCVGSFRTKVMEC